MRIGIYDPYLDDIGGGEKYMMTIAQCLSKTHIVDVFWDSQKDLDNISDRFSLDLAKINRVKNIFSSTTNLVKRSLQSQKYDVIIYLSDGSIPFLLSKKLYIHIQQPLKTFQNSNSKNKIKLSRVNGFFCNSEFTKSFIDKKWGIKTRVIYPPVELFPENIKKENIILHVGRFRVQDAITGVKDFKKQNVMIDTFKEMVDKGFKKWKFVLAISIQEKDEKEFEKMKEKAKGYPIEFLLNQKNKALWNAYSKAKIYWHASGFGEDLDHHPEYAEHFGISTVEAMGAGVVPVVINAGGQKEIVDDGKNGFLWNNLNELQEKTLNLINDTKMWESLSSRAINRAQFFAGDRFSNEVHALINS